MKVKPITRAGGIRPVETHRCPAPGCFTEVRNDWIACNDHEPLIPARLVQEVRNARGYYRRTSNPQMLTRALVDVFRWCQANIRNPNFDKPEREREAS